MNWAERLRTGMHGLAESLGNLLMEAFHYLALFAIGSITAWAAVMTFIGMLEKGHITVDDILLLFIYLELAAMVGIYFKTNHMPIRFMIYVAITALTRLLISDISHTHKPTWGVVMVSGAILLLALAILVVRYASSRFPAVAGPHPRSKARNREDAESERIAGNAAEPAAARQEAAWQAATLYDEAGATRQAMRSFADYAQRYPRPYGQQLKAYERLIAMSEAAGDTAANRRWLRALVAADQTAGTAAGERSRTLAARASLTLADDARAHYESLRLTPPLNRSLPAKKQAMDEALAGYHRTADYAIAEYTTEATYRIGALFADLARALLESPPPRGLSELEREEYQFLLEDQAFPLEERAVEAHAVNTRRTLEEIYDKWVRASYTQLAKLLPARYAKTERREASYDALD